MAEEYKLVKDSVYGYIQVSANFRFHLEVIG